MDVKPSNLMVLTNGEVRLIDFTGARYWREEEITQIAYTPESGGPEAFGGVKYVGPAYDVHGFGAVAYYLVTGAYPRVSGSSMKQGDPSPPPWNVLRKHPMLETIPALRDHLHAPLADRPGDRPDTRELTKWVAELGELVRRSRIEDVGVDWREADGADSGRAVGRARPAVTGTETGAYQRIEQLERELVALRSSSPPPPSPTSLTKVNGATSATALAAPSAAAAPSPAGAAPQMMGRAKVMPRPPREPTGVVVDPVEPRRDFYQPMRGERARALKIGWEFTGTGAFIAFICWGLWAADSKGTLTGPVVAFIIVLAVAAGVFALTRLLGRLILEQRLGKIRRTAKGAHALTGLFLAGAGIAYLRQVDWVMSAWNWLGGHLW